MKRGPFRSLRGHYHVRSIGGLITIMGGANTIGEAFGITASHVEAWLERGFIPGGWHLPLYTIAARRGLRVHPRVFGLSEKMIVRLDRRLKPRRQA